MNCCIVGVSRKRGDNMLPLCLTYLDSSADKVMFEEIFYGYRKQMLSLAVSIVKNYYDAEDIVHNVFLNIAQKNWDTVKGIKDKQDLRNYLLKATKNTSLNVLKSRKKQNASFDTVVEYNLNETVVSDEVFIESICNKMSYDEIINAIKLLSDRYKTVLYYHFVVELSVPKTAKLLGQSVSTTQKQLIRGKKMLLNLLDKKGGNEYAVK